jgi:hypothetical protein
VTIVFSGDPCELLRQGDDVGPFFKLLLRTRLGFYALPLKVPYVNILLERHPNRKMNHEAVFVRLPVGVEAGVQADRSNG